MRVLVTGADGFVGTRLVNRLEARGDEVVARDRDLDVRDAGAVTEALAAARPDAVVHLAALAFVPDSFGAPEEVYRVNFLGTRSVLEGCRQRAPGARVLIVASGAIYGSAAPGAPPFVEGDPLRPTSPYAWSKAAADRLAGLYAQGGLDVLRTRPFNHTGPGRPEQFVESSLARQIVERELGLRKGPIAVGNLESVRDFLDVDDVIEAYCSLLEPGVPAQAYNVASGTGRTVRSVFDELVSLSSVCPELEIDRSRWRPADTSVGDAQRLRHVAGWKPRIPFRDTLSRLMDAWRQQLRAA